LLPKRQRGACEIKMKRLVILALMFMVGSAFADERFNEGDGGSGIDSMELRTLEIKIGDIWGDVDSLMAGSKEVIDSFEIVWQAISPSSSSSPVELVYSIFWIDTVGWESKTETVPAPCPENLPGCCVMHWKTITVWTPKLDTTYIGTFVSDKREPIYDKKLLIKRELKTEKIKEMSGLNR